MLPTVFHNGLFDDLFYDPFDFVPGPMYQGRDPLYGKHAKNIMKTDISENGDHYEMAVDLPGFKKEDVQLKLEDGYLTIAASKNMDRDEKDENDRYIRRERWSGQCSRSFYVGDAIRPQDVSAKFEDGILRLTLPKAAQELPQNNLIEIE